MRTLRPMGWLACAALILSFSALPASANICPIWCLNPMSMQTATNNGVQGGSAEITIKNAVSSSFLPDLNYIEDADNGQDFEVADPFFGIVTLVQRDQVLKIKTSNHRLPVVLSFFDGSGNWIPIPAVIGSNKTISWPAAALPCIIWYSVSSPLTSAQVGQIVVVDNVDDELVNLLLGAADGVIGDLCSSGPSKANLAVLNLEDGESSGLTIIDEGDAIQWYNSFDSATTLTFSDGRTVVVPAHDRSAPEIFADEGNYTYTASGHNGMGIVQVNGPGVSNDSESWGTLKAGYGADE